MRFADLADRRIAIVIPNDTGSIVARGVAEYIAGSDARLEIPIEDESPSRPVFIIRESEFQGRFVLDTRYGCEYVVALQVPVGVPCE